MPARTGALFEQTVDCKCLTGVSALLLLAAAGCTVLAAADYRTEAGPVTVNRTVPKVSPPKARLEFSANPTVQEIFRARVFEEPLVPIGGEPSAEENAALAAALLGYAKRSGPDDFASLTGFLEEHPESPWRAALLTDLGLEYYNTAHYSLALDAWEKAWPLAKNATDLKGKAIADRAAGELAYMYARLGRMNDLEALLKSVEDRVFIGPATERIAGAREGLWNMKNRPEISFRCGPLALHRIKAATDPQPAAEMIIFESASTQKGLSLPQVAELSRKVGLNYQMAFREKGGDFVVPSVLHWKLDHYAAIIRREGDRYLLQDPTFRNDVWATRQALEAETSRYFLIPPGPLPKGWRAVDAKEGGSVWGKGFTQEKDEDLFACTDMQTGGSQSCSLSGSCPGMAVSSVHLMLVNLQLRDEPVRYSTPVGPPVQFVVRYNHRDGLQPAIFPYSNFGPKWTCDWLAYITDNPQSPLDDVKSYLRGGGGRTFKAFDTNSQSFGYQQYDQTLLRRTGPASYEITSRDGSKSLFAQSDGSTGTKRKIFLSQVVDAAGNTVTLDYDRNLRLLTISDAIGQNTRLVYGDTNDIYKITGVTDPFGRSASFEYDSLGRLTNITDVIGLKSQFRYEGKSDFINTLITPYGTNTFIVGAAGKTANWLETIYADGSRDRVEFNQSTNVGVPFSDPVTSVPKGMATFNQYLWFRNTFYWSRSASASAYGDYTKARIYHWLHSSNDLTTCSGILESTKEPLEGRVWYNYAGQGSAAFTGSTRRPSLVGRVLDDTTTQLSTYGYNGFGNLTNMIDPLGRTFSYIYAPNGIDLLEVRMTRAGKNQVLFQATYNSQHRPLATTDAARQTRTFSYNARGQVLTATNPKNETTTYTYNADGYLTAVDGPLPGTNDTMTLTYDSFGRVRTTTSVSGYTLTFDYDAMDRVTRITHPDSTFTEYTYDRLDLTSVRDRAGRQSFFEYDNLRQMKQSTDPLGRVSLFSWCRCGAVKSLTDPMGRTTEWHTDVQGRPSSKQYADGSQVSYFYENASGRLREVVDEKGQRTGFTYNHDNTLRSLSYPNAAVPTPVVSYTYDADYERLISMTDGTGTTLYSYNPITGVPALGAGHLASVDGPLPNDTVTYGYDELGRVVHRAINGVDEAMTYDADGRLIAVTNATGAFAYAYDGNSSRLVLRTFPNGQTEERSYDDNLHDRMLQRITHRLGGTPISEFIYGRDIPAGRITTWSQQAGAQTPNLHAFDYDAVNQLISVTVSNGGVLVNNFAYTYDATGNRLTEQIGTSNYPATYNSLNQLNTTTAPGVLRTNEWDAANRLVAVTAGNQRTEFTYDGLSRLVRIRRLVNGSEVTHRKFVWLGNRLREERDAAGTVVKRFFGHAVKLESGPVTGAFFYTRDHLGSIREVTDSSGIVRAHYAYDPYGRRTRLSGDVEADFGLAGMFWSAEARLYLTHFRVYDADLGRWLSRDPLGHAEMRQGPNLYAYVANDPVNRIDPEGLACAGTLCLCGKEPGLCAAIAGAAAAGGGAAANELETAGPALENTIQCGLEATLPAIEAILPAAEAELPAAESALPEAEFGIQLFIEEGEPVALQTLQGVGPVGPDAAFRAVVEARRIAAAAENFAEGLARQPVWEQWWYRTLEATRQWRQDLPVQDQIEIQRAIFDTARLLFGAE